MYTITEVSRITTTNPEIVQYAIRTEKHLPQRMQVFFMIIAQRDSYPVSTLNKNFIENPLTQKYSSPHLLTIGYF